MSATLSHSLGLCSLVLFCRERVHDTMLVVDTTLLCHFSRHRISDAFLRVSVAACDEIHLISQVETRSHAAIIVREYLLGD